MRNGMKHAAMLAAIGTMAMAGAATAQTTVTPELIIKLDREREIVVTAKPDPEPKVREARAQARSITYASNIFDESLPVFQKQLCPGVTGLPVELAELIADRIRYNAERVGLRLANVEGCKVNLLVAFVMNGQKTLNDIAGDGRSMMANLTAAERRELLNDPGPVHAFIVWSLRTLDGMPVSWDPNNQYAVVETHSAHSLITQASRKDIEMSVVLIDIPAIDGMSAVQIADYATMRGIAKTRPVSGDTNYGTILNLFDEDSLHPLELTNFDVAYLKAVYTRPPNIAAASKLGTVGGAMKKELKALEASFNE